MVVEQQAPALTLSFIAEQLVEKFGSENATAKATGVSRRSLRRLRGKDGGVSQVPEHRTLSALAQALENLSKADKPVLWHGQPVLMTSAELWSLHEQTKPDTSLKEQIRGLLDKMTDEQLTAILEFAQSVLMSPVENGSRFHKHQLNQDLSLSVGNNLRRLIQVNLDNIKKSDDEDIKVTVKRLLTLKTNNHKPTQQTVQDVIIFLNQNILPENMFPLFSVLCKSLRKVENGKVVEEEGFEEVEDLINYLGY